MRTNFKGSIIVSALLGPLAWGMAAADPIAFDYAGYRLDTTGLNTIGQTFGSVGGTVRTLFVAGITPDAGTTSSATLSGSPTTAVLYDAPSDQWYRSVFNPSAADLGPLTVTFQNGADTRTFVGRDLTGLTPMKLAENLSVDASVDPFGPTFNWTLPTDSGDIDAVQLVFFNNLTNLEVGTRQTLAANATSFDLYGGGTGGLLPLGFALTVEVRMVDLFNDEMPPDVSNVQRASHAFINYNAPAIAAIPEPQTYALMLAGLGVLGCVARRRRQQA